MEYVENESPRDIAKHSIVTQYADYRVRGWSRGQAIKEIVGYFNDIQQFGWNWWFRFGDEGKAVARELASPEAVEAVVDAAEKSS